MKKYIAFLFAFAFIFSFNLNLVGAQTTTNVCRPGDNYSPTTGEKCTNTTPVDVCGPGDVYNTKTGEKCIDTPTIPTYPRCDRTFSSTLKVGSRGTEVMALQQSLKEEGLYTGKVDGVYGPITDGAKLSYLKKCPTKNTGGVSITGVKGPTKLGVGDKGEWTIIAYGENLSYSVRWGDESNYSTAVSASGKSTEQQTATFTHTYLTAGEYNPKFTVTSSNSGGSETVSVSVKVGTGNNSSTVTVLSPNGGEIWKKGTTQTIKWKDTNNISTHEIHVMGTDPYTGQMTSNYTIANTQGSSYSWKVGEVWGDSNGLSKGAYILQVCQSSSTNCDSSNSYFNITDGDTTSKPTITQVSNNISTESNDNGEAVKASGNFKFKVYSPADTIYVLNEDARDYVNSVFTTGSTAKSSWAGLSSDTYVSGDTGTSFKVGAGATRTFTLQFGIESTNGTGFYKAKATSLKLKSGSSVNFGSDFVTSSVYLTGTATNLNPVISVVYPEGCSINSVYSTTTGLLCTEAGIGYTVTVSGSNFRNGDSIKMYSSTTGDLVTFPTTFVSSTKLTFKVLSTAGIGVRGFRVYTTAGVTSNTVSLTFVDPGNTSSVTVLSPNGGEEWTKGSRKTISWSDSAGSLCPSGVQCVWAGVPYDVKLIPSSGTTRTIASSVYSYSYTFTPSSDIADGSYAVQVCKVGTSICDSSDRSFTIYETPTFACSYAPPTDGCTYTPGPNYDSKTGCGMVLSCGSVQGAEVYNFTLLLKKGSRGNEVMELQKFLKEAGYGSVYADGNFGSGTESAVIKFQLANGLKADGVVGSGTRALLNKPR